MDNQKSESEAVSTKTKSVNAGKSVKENTISANDLGELADLMVALSRSLLESGCSSSRLEHIVGKLGKAYGVHVESMAVPAGVWLSLRSGDLRITELTRVQGWSVDLDRLARISQLVELLVTKNLPIDSAKKRIEKLFEEQGPYPSYLTYLAFAGAAGALVHFYNGSAQEILLSGILGLCVGVIQHQLIKKESRRYLSDFVSSVFVTSCAIVASHFLPGFDTFRVIVGGIIVLIPGLVAVNAVSELAQKNLVSGTAKLVEAIMITGAVVSGILLTVALAREIGVFWG